MKLYSANGTVADIRLRDPKKADERRERAQRRADRGQRVFVWSLALFFAAVGLYVASGGLSPADRYAPASVQGPAIIDPPGGWTGIDVDRYGIIRHGGVVVGSLHDESGDTVRNAYLAGLAQFRGDDAHDVEDGVRFCALLASGDPDALRIRLDADSDQPQFGSDPRATQLAAAAVVNLCPRFGQ